MNNWRITLKNSFNIKLYLLTVWILLTISLIWLAFHYLLHVDYCPHVCCYHVLAIMPSDLLQVLVNVGNPHDISNWTFDLIYRVYRFHFTVYVSRHLMLFFFSTAQLLLCFTLSLSLHYPANGLYSQLLCHKI